MGRTISMSINVDTSTPPSLILLDEPTNHLDIRSREHLAAVLSDYEGSLVIISHDRFFLDGFVNRVWEVVDGQVREYDGNYSEYELTKVNEKPIEKKVKDVEKNIPSSFFLEKERKRKEAQERNSRYKQLKPLEKRLEEVENRLEMLMMENEQLQSKLAESNLYQANQKNLLIATIEQQRDLKKVEQALIKEWDQLTMSIEKIQKNKE